MGKNTSRTIKLAVPSLLALILMNSSIYPSYHKLSTDTVYKPIAYNEIYCKQDIDIVFFDDFSKRDTFEEVNNEKESKLIETYEEVEFQTVYQEDKDLELGKEIISKKGVPGKQKVIYEETYVDGKLIMSKEINRTIVKTASDRVVNVGVNPFIKSNNNINSGSLPEKFPYKYLDKYESEMLKIINRHRYESGVNPLKRRRELDISARYKSLSMLQLDYFGHENPQFKDESFSYLMTEFLNLENYSTLGENLAYKSSEKIKINSLQEIFSALKESTGHNENMLSEDYEYIGIGIVYSEHPGVKYENKPTITITNHFGK